MNYKHVKLLIFVLMTPFYINESYNLLILLANKMYAKVRRSHNTIIQKVHVAEKTIPDFPFVFRGFSPATGTVFFNEIKYMYKACTSKFFSSAPGY